MNLPPQLAALAHNKAALAGVGGVAAIGLLVHARNKKTGTGTTGSSISQVAADSGGSGTSGGVADGSAGPTTYPNTYGTDLATALGNIDSQYAGQVAAFNQQLSSVQNSLTTLTAAQAGTGTSVGSMSPKYITVAPKETQKDIISKAGISYKQFTAWNPSLAKKGSKVHAGEKVRIG